MIRTITTTDIKALIKQISIKTFMQELLTCLRQDYNAWHDFKLSPRHAFHIDQGVLELMPVCGKQYYACKYVNGHPANPLQNKQTVIAIGMLADVATGYPLMLSEMTALTALRTAGTAALAATYLARKDSQQIALIGTGAQAEFLVLAHHFALGINRFHYYDVDNAAMEKMARNLAAYSLELIPGHNIENTVKEADIIITATAAKKNASLLEDAWLQPGVHITGIGGDCPGKTELNPQLVARSKVVVEYLPQTQHEGEIQNSAKDVYAELWELVNHNKPGRESTDEITLFDSVGFALEDYSILRYVYQLAQQYNLGKDCELIPNLADPKNLFAAIV